MKKACAKVFWKEEIDARNKEIRLGKNILGVCFEGWSEHIKGQKRLKDQKRYSEIIMWN